MAPWHISWCLINFWGTFESNYYQGNKNIGLLRKLQKTLPRPALMTMYKAFVRSHLDYGDIIYDEAYNETFHQKLASIQHNACLVLLRVIRGSSKGKLYHD